MSRLFVSHTWVLTVRTQTGHEDDEVGNSRRNGRTAAGVLRTKEGRQQEFKGRGGVAGGHHNPKARRRLDSFHTHDSSRVQEGTSTEGPGYPWGEGRVVTDHCHTSTSRSRSKGDFPHVRKIRMRTFLSMLILKGTFNFSDKFIKLIICESDHYTGPD